MQDVAVLLYSMEEVEFHSKKLDSEIFPGIVLLMSLCVSGFACPAVLPHWAGEEGDEFSAEISWTGIEKPLM